MAAEIANLIWPSHGDWSRFNEAAANGRGNLPARTSLGTLPMELQ